MGNTQRDLLLLCLSLICLNIISCSQGPVGLRFGHNSEPRSEDGAKPEAEAEANTSTTATVSFADVNERVFKSSCQNCHANRDKPFMNYYQDYKKKIKLITQQVLVLKKMPKRKSLSQEQLALLKLWIDQGAPEFAIGAKDTSPIPSVSPTPSPTPPTQGTITTEVPPTSWQEVNKAIFADYCNNCHFDKNTDGLSSYEDPKTVRATIGTVFYTSIVNPVMPPPPKDWDENKPNPNQLTRAQKDLLSKWIIEGMKD